MLKYINILFTIYTTTIKALKNIIASSLFNSKIKSGKSDSYFEFCTLFKNDSSSNNAIIGITKLIPIVSKIDVARESEDKPSWMGKVDFSGLKLKLIASIVAISSIGLLEAFIDVGSNTSEEIYLMIYIHAIFIFSGVFIAVMDYIASKTISHYTDEDPNK